MTKTNGDKKILLMPTNDDNAKLMKRILSIFVSSMKCKNTKNNDKITYDTNFIHCHVFKKNVKNLKTMDETNKNGDKKI